MRRAGRSLLVALFLVSAGCDDGAADAVADGDLAALRAYLDDDGDPDAVVRFRHPDFARGERVARRLLVSAAVHGQATAVRMLLGAGASVTHPDGGFAICPAAAFGYAEIVSMLLGAGAPATPARRCGADGDLTAVAIAEARGHPAVARLLRNAGGR